MVSSELLKEFGFEEEVFEVNTGNFQKTGFPKSSKRYSLVYEMPDLSVEEPYYWVVDNILKKCTKLEKVEDSFSASENSAFFGVTQQRLGAQQDKISQLLATIGKMVKELFQMVRELRIIDERVEYYRGSAAEEKKELRDRKNSNEITLKGIFVDLVQGGGKSPSSVFGMASQLEFVTLPDLFFDAPPFKSVNEMEKYVNGLEDFNLSVRRVLKRHLRHFMEWKKSTYKEHENRRKFQLKYLRQHYDIIQMYMQWIKPYLKNVRRLHFKKEHQDSAELVSAFEGSMIDIEIAGYNPDQKGCVLITFRYRTRPHMKFVQEGYQRGPVHVGKLDLFFRSYDWDEKKIMKYKKMKEKENLELLGDVSQSVSEAMKGLGSELERYYLEAKGKIEDKEVKGVADKKEVAREPVSLVRKLFGDFLPPAKKKGKGQESEKESSGKKGKFNSEATARGLYRYFKKAHRMVTW